MGDELEVIVQDADAGSGGVGELGVEELGSSGGVGSGGVEKLGSVEWFREADRGQSDALNKGFAKAKGEWFFWLNADDVLLPDALKKVQQLITHNSQLTTHLNWIAGNQLLVDEKGKVVKCSVGNGWHDWLYRRAVPHVYGPGSFFKKELFELVGGFDASLKYCMDWDLWIKFMKAGARFERTDEYLWAQRQWNGSKTQRGKSKKEAAVQWVEIDKMLDKNDMQVTALGNFGVRLWRMLNGNIMRQAIDGMRYRGKHYSEMFL